MELATIADMKPQIYYIDDANGFLPKCNKCDENRLIHFKSPSGRECTEPCPNCGTSFRKYFVKPVDTLRISFPNDPQIKRVAYYLRHDRWGESYTYNLQDIYRGPAEEFDLQVNRNHIAFESEELAQEICNRLNKKYGVPEKVEVYSKD